MWYPHVTVATVVPRKGRFLLVRERVNGREFYNQPAGHLEKDESLIQAAIRETREETGWLVEPRYVLGISQYTSPVNEVTYIRTTFLAEPVHELEGAVLDEGILEALWLTPEEVRTRQAQLRSPMVISDLERFMRGDRFPLELIRQDR